MKIATIKANNTSDFDRLVNQFNAVHDVKFTQTHAVSHGELIHFIAVLYYNPKLVNSKIDYTAGTSKSISAKLHNHPVTGTTTPKEAAKLMFSGVKKVTQEEAGDRILVPK